MLALLLVALLSAPSAALVPRHMLVEDVATCMKSCDRQYAVDIAQCLKMVKEKAEDNQLPPTGEVYDQLSTQCYGFYQPVLGRCKAACRTVSKPPETPAGTGSVDTKPQAADTKPPVETGSADPQPTATTDPNPAEDAGTQDTEHVKASDTGNP
jgi:hypothetical protein